MDNCESNITNYIKYWDEWHKEWHKNVNKIPLNLNQIKGWNVPLGNGGNEQDIWRYFPEPYWGNSFLEKLDAVFLNLNPGAGGDCQDVKSPNIVNSNLFNIYSANNNSFSKTVSILIKNTCYTTTNWFIQKRVNWINKLYKSIGLNESCLIETILCADLIPWHTPSATSIAKYINRHKQLIEKHVLIPITNLSQCAKMKGVVFAKGRIIERLLIDIGANKIAEYKNGRFFIIIFEYNDAKIIVFIGGQGMSLPNPTIIYTDIVSGKMLSITQIINNQL